MPRMRLIDWPALIVWIVRKHEVAGLRRGERDFDRRAVAHFADEDDLRRLPQGGAQPARESVEIAAELALVEGGLLVLVHEFDRVLQRDHVDRLRLVDLVEDRGERGRLAAAGGAGDEDEAVLLSRMSRKIGASPSELSVGISLCALRMTMAKCPRCLKIFTRKRAAIHRVSSCNRTRRA